jgi:hypothetical protein|tara:strand:- start:252 stop:434 length:183 start_codon:yes stop_codon:yes gene_type:complete
MFNKEKKPESEFFSSKEEESLPLQEDKPVTGELNDPNVPMRRKNRVLNDGKDWFDTHPDA